MTASRRGSRGSTSAVSAPSMRRMSGWCPAAAASTVRAFDEERTRYIRRYFAADWQRPSLYHLTVNTSWLSVEQSVDLIVQAAAMVDRR